MRIQTLKDEKRLKEFQRLADQHIGVCFPIDYLSRSKVVAYMDNEDNMVGGYVFVTRPPFRVIDSLPDEHRATCNVLRNIDLTSCFEITGLWLAPQVRSGRLSLRFWLNMYKDVVLSGKRHFVYAYCLKKRKLGQLYQVAQPRVIFRGETKILEGMKESSEESVEVASTRMATFAWLHSPGFVFRRALARRRVARPRDLDYVHQLQAQE